MEPCSDADASQATSSKGIDEGHCPRGSQTSVEKRGADPPEATQLFRLLTLETHPDFSDVSLRAEQKGGYISFKIRSLYNRPVIHERFGHIVSHASDL